MTREEVKAQLAKCPLVWAFENGCHLSTPTNDADTKFRYRISEDDVIVSLEIFGEYIKTNEAAYMDIVAKVPKGIDSLGELKEFADFHRLSLICAQHGVKEQPQGVTLKE